MMMPPLAPPRFRPPGKYLWDPWFCKHNGAWHMFFLQADDTLHPDERHHHASIGMATSADLQNWSYAGTALAAGQAGEWDDVAIWTGSTFVWEGQWYLYYTARSRSRFWWQQLGLATSSDLRTWQKIPGNPILASDSRYYDASESLDGRGVPPAWRDPYVFHSAEDDCFYMLVCARSACATSLFNGCIGIARSLDLLHWETLPPLLAPGIYAEMEVPQIFHRNGRWYLFFATQAKHYEPAWGAEHGFHSGLHCFVADELFGSYRPVNRTGAIPADGLGVYFLRPLEWHGRSCTALGWLDRSDDGVFLGTLSDLYELDVSEDLVIAVPLPGAL